MKLDRNINPDGRGKYALLKLRAVAIQTKLPSDEVDAAIQKLVDAGVIDFGDTPDTEFFVIRLKDRYAGKALLAYSHAAMMYDPEWGLEIEALARNAILRTDKKNPD